VVASGLVGCGGSDADRPGPVDATVGGLAVFRPPAPGAGAAWGDLPFPSDLYLDGSGHLALTSLPVGAQATADAVTTLLESLATLEGAGVRSNVYLPVDAALEPASLAAAARLIDLDASAAGALVEVPVEAIWRDDLRLVVLALPRGVVLRRGHRYAAYLTSAARVASGGVLGAPPALAAILAGTASGAAEQAAAASLQPLLDVLPADVRASLASATVFRTHDPARDTLRMRDVLVQSAQTPALRSIDSIYGPGETGGRGLQAQFGAQAADAVPGQLNNGPRGQPHGRVALVIQATLDMPSFLSADPGVDGFPHVGDDGTPEVRGRHPLKITLTLPRIASWSNLPVIVYGHGVGRTRQDMMMQADTAARAGAAMIAVDFEHHGSRLGGTGSDARNDLVGTEVADGFGDYVALLPILNYFHQVESGGIPARHPRAIAETLRQSALDIVSLVEWVADGDPGLLVAALDALPDDPAVRPDLSFRDDVGLLSESLGGLVSGVSLAIEPRIGVAFLSAPAAGFPAPAFTSSPNYSTDFLPVLTGPYDVANRLAPGDLDAGVDPLVSLFGSVMERGDALAYAPAVADGSLRGGSRPDVVVSMYWGDVWVANDTQEGYARALGLPLVPFAAAPVQPPGVPRFAELTTSAPPISGNADGRTAGFLVFHPAGHTALRNLREDRNYQPMFPPLVIQQPPENIEPQQTAQIHATWGALFADHMAGRVPTVRDPYAP
jgi:hypothetical protein